MNEKIQIQSCPNQHNAHDDRKIKEKDIRRVKCLAPQCSYSQHFKWLSPFSWSCCLVTERNMRKQENEEMEKESQQKNPAGKMVRKLWLVAMFYVESRRETLVTVDSWDWSGIARKKKRLEDYSRRRKQTKRKTTKLMCWHVDTAHKIGYVSALKLFMASLTTVWLLTCYCHIIGLHW